MVYVAVTNQCNEPIHFVCLSQVVIVVTHFTEFIYKIQFFIFGNVKVPKTVVPSVMINLIVIELTEINFFFT